MAQNTALQTLFDELEKLGENYSEPFKAFHLGNERQQIIDGYKNGFYAGCDQPLMDNMPDDYFTNTFKQ